MNNDMLNNDKKNIDSRLDREQRIDPRTGFVVGSDEYNNLYFGIKPKKNIDQEYKKTKLDIDPSLGVIEKIDPRTGFVVGSDEYNKYYFEKKKMEMAKEIIDPVTKFVVGSAEYNAYYGIDIQDESIGARKL